MSKILCTCWEDWDVREEGAPGCRETPTSTVSRPTEEDVKVAKVTPIDGGYISAVAAELMDTLIKKNADYAGDLEFFNFEQAAEFAGLKVMDVMLTQIAIKYTRIANLHGGTVPKNESLRDSFVDLAGYAVIAAAWLDAVNGDQDNG